MLLPLIVATVGCRDRYEGQAGAAASPSPTASPDAYSPPATTASPYEGPATHLEAATVSAQVVSVDAAGRTITLREAGAPTTERGQRLSVASEAADVLRGLQAGDRVTVRCNGTTGARGSTGTETTSGTMGSLAGCTIATMITKEAPGTR